MKEAYLQEVVSAGEVVTAEEGCLEEERPMEVGCPQEEGPAAVGFPQGEELAEEACSVEEGKAGLGYQGEEDLQTRNTGDHTTTRQECEFQIYRADPGAKERWDCSFQKKGSLGGGGLLGGGGEGGGVF